MTTDQKPQTANDVAKLIQQAAWLHESSFDWPSLVKDTEKKLKARRMLRKAGFNEPESLPTDHLHRYYNKSLSQAVYEVCKDGKDSWAPSVCVHTSLAVVLAVLPLVNAAAFLICVGLKLDSVGK
mgnify:CR=1 FL=1